MKASILFTFSLLLFTSLFAAPGGKGGGEPVAAGFPAWVVPGGKAHIRGREICPSDLRHKITIVVEFDAAKAKEQLPKAATIGRFQPMQGSDSFAPDWIHQNRIKREVQVVFSNVGAKKDDEITNLLDTKDKATATTIQGLRTGEIPFYDGVTFAGAPANEGKLPFVYVMGPTGTEPLYKGAVDYTAINKIVGAAKKELPDWKPFYGTVMEPKHVGKDIAKQMAKGKPLSVVSDKAKKFVTSADAEVAKESQIIYDALEQTRSDMEYRISLEVTTAPYCAAYDIDTVTKYWPATKKRMEKFLAKANALPEYATINKAYALCKKYGDPDFTCKNAAEAKKLTATMQKLKKDLQPLRESKTIAIQNAALLVDSEVDDTIAALPTKVPAK